MSEESRSRLYQLGLVWVAMVAAGILSIGLGYLFENFIWEPPAAGLHLGGALLIIASASPAASILGELPGKWKFGAVSSLGAIFAVNMGIAYLHYRSVFNDVLFLMLAAMTILAMVVVLGAADAYSAKLKEVIFRV